VTSRSPIHLVEQLEQQRRAADTLVGTFLGDQVDVIEDDRRRLEHARHRARLLQENVPCPVINNTVRSGARRRIEAQRTGTTDAAS
jgi:hypothetical protein